MAAERPILQHVLDNLVLIGRTEDIRKLLVGWFVQQTSRSRIFVFKHIERIDYFRQRNAVIFLVLAKRFSVDHENHRQGMFVHSAVGNINDLFEAGHDDEGDACVCFDL